MTATTITRTLTLALALAAGACGDGDDGAETAADTTAAAPPAPAAAADAEFLREMTNHHEGLVLIAERAHTRAADDSVRTVAGNLHTKQSTERDSMVAMLGRDFGQQHTPQAMQKNVAQADTVAQKSAAEHDRYFLETVIAHHREGIGMIDRFLPRLTNAQVRSMTEQMKAVQQAEIQELEGKLGSL